MTSHRAILFSSHAFHLCNIKTHAVEAAEMVSMSMNALENFGRGCCIRTPRGHQHAAPLWGRHSSSFARAGGGDGWWGRRQNQWVATPSANLAG